LSDFDEYGEYDPAADALYIRVRVGEVARQVPVTPEVIADVTESGAVVGVEVLYPGQNLSVALAWLRAQGLAPAGSGVR
jgi:uncharacterized protein YuzE